MGSSRYQNIYCSKCGQQCAIQATETGRIVHGFAVQDKNDCWICKECNEKGG